MHNMKHVVILNTVSKKCDIYSVSLNTIDIHTIYLHIIYMRKVINLTPDVLVVKYPINICKIKYFTKYHH